MSKSVSSTLFFLILLSVFSVHAQTETPLLERVITIRFNKDPLDVVLKKIEEEGNVTFSYNASIIDSKKIITKTFKKKTVREVLDQIFEGTLEYKARGKYIILTKAPTSSLDYSRVLSGYVIDEATGERIKNVSVYDPVTLSSAVTDSYGYFEIKIDKPSADVILSVNKQAYADTVINVSKNESDRLLNIPIKVDKEKITVMADSVGQKIKRFWKTLLKPGNVNLDNIDDTLYRDYQMSLLPFVGTNHKLSGHVINNYSFNVLGGYSLGTRKAELAGLFNLVRGDVEGVQLAGLFNATGENMRGVQAATIFNATRGEMDGVQLAGVLNFNWSDAKKVSAAGMLNFNLRNSYAVQVAGLSNITIGEQHRPHVAGFFNFTAHDAGPVQLAGLFNFSGANARGTQVAGGFNFAAKNVEGVQVASFFNFAGKEVNGSQVSALLNVAKDVKGSQIGFLNIAKTMKGVPVGFLSFVAKGYHKIEFSADEIFYSNVAFRTGVHQFYNIFTAGAKPSTFKGDSTFWTFGYGVGSAPKLSRTLFLNFDLTANQIVYGNDLAAVNLLNKLYVGFDVQLAKHLSFTFGATLNGYVTDVAHQQYKPLFTEYQPDIIEDRTFFNDLNLKMWWGGKIGLRFL